MLKIMIFIDGTWLYSNTYKLSDAYGDPNFHVDFGKLPLVLAEEISRKAGGAAVEVVRTHLFGSSPTNYDPKDEEMVARRWDFFEMLREEYHYDVEIFPIDFKGRRLRKVDRQPDDTFEPREKCVDIALASAMLYYAAIPYAYDIAIAVFGDRDFVPLLQSVRRLGKRVAIASIKGSCSPVFADPRDEMRLKDFDIIWLDDLLPRLELKFERHQERCESPIHKGDPLVWTTYRPRKGKRFFCEVCRAEYQRQKREAQRELLGSTEEFEEESPAENGEFYERWQTGMIKRLIPAKSYGFILSKTGRDYFFHLTDLDGLEFEELYEGMEVEFEVRKEPSGGRAGAAQNVQPHIV